MRRRRRGSASEQAEPSTPEESTPEVPGPRSDGPWDISEHPIDESDDTRVNLGSLVIEANQETELRLQVDEQSGEVQAVMLVAADGALELRAFAAPRHEDIWEDIRPRIAEEAKRMGGTATETEGPYGTALQMTVPAVTPDGQQVTQPSTVIGISGPRWLLRVSMFGRPAVAYEPDGLLETCLRGVVVDRGTQPMPPGEPLPLSLPAGAQRLDS